MITEFELGKGDKMISQNCRREKVGFLNRLAIAKVEKFPEDCGPRESEYHPG